MCRWGQKKGLQRCDRPMAIDALTSQSINTTTIVGSDTPDIDQWEIVLNRRNKRVMFGEVADVRRTKLTDTKPR